MHKCTHETKQNVVLPNIIIEYPEEDPINLFNEISLNTTFKPKVVLTDIEEQTKLFLRCDSIFILVQTSHNLFVIKKQKKKIKIIF